MKNIHSKKGFTLVEIMIVVVIIGLLAALAVPAFNRVRRSSIQSTMENDARQLSAAANQYFLENGVTQVASTDIIGTETGTAARNMRQLSRGVALTPVVTLIQGETFALVHANIGTMSFRVDDGRNN